MRKVIVLLLLCALSLSKFSICSFAEPAEYYTYFSENSSRRTDVPDVPADISSAEYSDADVEYGACEDVAKALLWKTGGGNVTFNFSVPEDGLYNLMLTYIPLESGISAITVGLEVDGAQPFNGLNSIALPRLFENSGSVRTDGVGNEFAPEQAEAMKWQSARITDDEGLNDSPYLFAIDAGSHTVTLSNLSADIAISDIRFCAAEAPLSYDELLKKYKEQKYAEYSGKQIVVQGEDAALKTSNVLIGQSDSTSAKVYPYDPFISRINYIGGNNWNGAGDTITWKVNVSKSGLYKLGIGYQQSYLINGSAYRQLRIDDEIPFAEAKQIKFDYCNSWEHMTFSNDDGEPYLFYLTEGEHTVSLSVNLGDLSAFSVSLKSLIFELGDIYRQITMITGESPDANRDYNLFGQVPDLEERLKDGVALLDSLIKESEAVNGKGGASATSTMKNMSAVMQRMLDYKYQAQIYKNSFYDNYSAISAGLYELISMPLDIDALYFSAPDADEQPLGADFWGCALFSVKRFLASMVNDYNSVSGDNTHDDSITLWVNWGRDQVQVLNYLAQSDFTSKTGVGVEIKMTNATLIQAILSGSSPDCYLHMSRTEPVNLAMRGALYDLTEFSDFDTVCERFMPTATEPYRYGEGVYALPDTQTFSVMFYRKDILDELEVEIPQTWDDFLAASAVIMRNNMQVGLPYTQITNMSQINLGLGALNIFPTLLIQNGGSLYDENLSSALLTSEKSVEAFTMWTDFYTKYSFPKTYDFYNRFRIGVMPLVIQSCAQYTTLSAAASEINDLWGIAPIPGTEQPDGSISRLQAGAGTGCAILENSDNKSSAWEFLKWWTSDDIQYRYSQNIESILGMTGRNMTSNVNALSMLSWSGNDFEVLREQWAEVSEMPEVPGGYYIPRVIDQAFWNVVESGKHPEEMLLKWDAVADNEIAEKRSQYNK